MSLRNLPDPEFIDRDPSVITTEMITQYESMTAKTLYPAQPERLLLDVAAYRETLTRIGVNEAAKLNLVRYSRAPILDYLGEDRGVTRLAASSALTTLRFTLAAAQGSDYSIASGTRVAAKSNQVIFATTENAVIPAGSLFTDAAAAAEIAGSAGNGFLPGEISQPVAAIQGLDNVVNLSSSYGGLDEEDDERLRERIMLAPEGYAAAGPEGAYRYWSLSAHQSIADASVVSPYPGLVCVYVLLKSGVPGQEILDLVSQTLNHSKRRPLTDQVAVLPASPVRFSLNLNVTLYSWADQDLARTSIQTALIAHTDNLRLLLGRDVVASQIVTCAGKVSGVREIELLSPGNLSIAAHQYADCQSLNVNMSGWNDS